MTEARGGDHVLRALTDDGAFRVITARTTDTVAAAIQRQRASGATARHFGDLLTCAILFRETMAPDLRVQAIVKGVGATGSLVADAHPSGSTRGLVQLPEGVGEIVIGAGALLRMLRTLPGGRIQQGVVEVRAGGAVSDALMAYMQSSEQVDTMLAVATAMDGERVVAAGGYLVQLLPEVGRGPLMVMAERLEEFRDVTAHVRAAAFSPERLLGELLHAMSFTEVGRGDLSFDCWCDEARVLGALATLGRADLEHLLESGEALSISCDYCRREYGVPVATLRGLRERS